VYSVINQKLNNDLLKSAGRYLIFLTLHHVYVFILSYGKSFYDLNINSGTHILACPNQKTGG